MAAKAAEYYQNNKDRMRNAKNAYKRILRRTPGLNRAMCAMRDSAIVRATPKWADRNSVVMIYRKAAEMGLTVDHIVPLNSKLVCGLHVWDNLQLLDNVENVRKGNRHWPDCP